MRKILFLLFFFLFLSGNVFSYTDLQLRFAIITVLSADSRLTLVVETFRVSSYEILKNGSKYTDYYCDFSNVSLSGNVVRAILHSNLSGKDYTYQYTFVDVSDVDGRSLAKKYSYGGIDYYFNSDGKSLSVFTIEGELVYPVYDDGKILGYRTTSGKFYELKYNLSGNSVGLIYCSDTGKYYNLTGVLQDVNRVYDSFHAPIGYYNSTDDSYFDNGWHRKVSGLNTVFDYFQPVIDSNDNLIGFIGKNDEWRDEFGRLISAPSGYEGYIANSDLPFYQPVYDSGGNVVGWGSGSGAFVRNSKPFSDSPVDPPTVDPPTVDPPTVDPPTVDPPTVDPPIVDPPTVDPPTVDPPTDNIVVPPLPSSIVNPSLSSPGSLPIIPRDSWRFEGVYFKRDISGKLFFDSSIFFGEFKDKFVSKFGLLDIVKKLELGDTTIEPFTFEFFYPSIFESMAGKSFSFTFDLNSVILHIPESVIFLVRTLLLFFVYFEFLLLTIKIFA
ncbi:MAG: hypothetical protein LBC74_02180 [Planctomycetaceae bacterium]|jgi:hypothetical protein|nr:hypothetical protein [Planctomycetaceae bacterium]